MYQPNNLKICIKLYEMKYCNLMYNLYEYNDMLAMTVLGSDSAVTCALVEHFYDLV